MLFEVDAFFGADGVFALEGILFFAAENVFFAVESAVFFAVDALAATLNLPRSCNFFRICAIVPFPFKLFACIAQDVKVVPAFSATL